MKKLLNINRLLKDKNFATKVQIFMSTKTMGDDFDVYENNYVFANLNPITIKAYVHELSPETAFWKEYGLHQGGMKEIITEYRWRSAFENANKIVIDSIEYQVFKSGGGSNTMITQRPNNLLRVVVSRLD